MSISINELTIPTNAWTPLAMFLLAKAHHVLAQPPENWTWIERAMKDPSRLPYDFAIKVIADPTDEETAAVMCDALEERYGYKREHGSAPDLAAEIVRIICDIYSNAMHAMGQVT